MRLCRRNENPLTTFFTSDTHFGHANIIRLSSRPFPDVVAMDTGLIANWNARVKPGDTVWHLGDFTLANAETAEEYLRHLNGNIQLLPR
jgi:calcineurin-like phosphoesterase family protein